MAKKHQVYCTTSKLAGPLTLVFESDDESEAFTWLTLIHCSNPETSGENWKRRLCDHGWWITNHFRTPLLTGTDWVNQRWGK